MVEEDVGLGVEHLGDRHPSHAGVIKEEPLAGVRRVLVAGPGVAVVVGAVAIDDAFIATTQLTHEVVETQRPGVRLLEAGDKFLRGNFTPLRDVTDVVTVVEAA